MACAHRIARLPQRAVEDTKRILNLHLERAVLATLDFALSAEDRSFTSPELRANLDRLLPGDGRSRGPREPSRSRARVAAAARSLQADRTSFSPVNRNNTCSVRFTMFSEIG